MNFHHRLLFFFLLIASSLQAQSPWTQSQAGFYVQAGYFFLPTYDKLFTETTDLNLQRDISAQIFQIYGEYGISHKTTFVAQIPLHFLKNGAENVALPLIEKGKIAGLGNVSLGLRHNFFQKNSTFSGQMDVELPATTYGETTGLRTGYKALAFVPSLSIGKGLRRGYVYLNAAYGFRGNGYSQFLRSNAEFGRRFNKIWLVGSLGWLYSLKDGDIALPTENLLTGSFVDKQSYLSFTTKAIYQKDQFLSFGLYFSGAFQAENLPKSPNIGLFAAFKWD